MFDPELARREAVVAETWEAWRAAVKACEEYRRVGAPPQPVRFARVELGSQPPPAWPKLGTLCRWAKCNKPMKYPRPYRHFCNDVCKESELEARIMAGNYVPKKPAGMRRLGG